MASQAEIEIRRARARDCYYMSRRRPEWPMRKKPDIGYQKRYIAEEVAKYGPIPKESPETRTPEEMDAMRRAVYEALGIMEGK